MKDDKLTPACKEELLKAFMLEQFYFEGLEEVGLFKGVAPDDYEKQADIICRFMGLDSIYEYGAATVSALVLNGDGKPEFSVSENIYGTPSNCELANIVGKKLVLHWDEVPILWAGRNKFGQIVVASACVRWEDRSPDKDIVSVVSEKMYCDLVEGRTSYLKLIQQAEYIFVATSFADSTKVVVDSIGFDEIPKEWRPLEGSIKNWGSIEDFKV